MTTTQNNNDKKIIIDFRYNKWTIGSSLYSAVTIASGIAYIATAGFFATAGAPFVLLTALVLALAFPLMGAMVDSTAANNRGAKTAIENMPNDLRSRYLQAKSILWTKGERALNQAGKQAFEDGNAFMAPYQEAELAAFGEKNLLVRTLTFLKNIRKASTYST